MKRVAAGVLGAFALVVLGAALARAGEVEIKEADVPKKVTEAIQKKYPGAAYKEFSKEEKDRKVEYEAAIELKTKVKEGDHETEVTRYLDVTLSPEGTFLEEEETLDPKKLPDVVAKAIKGSKYEGMEVVKLERVVREEKEADASYEIHVKKGDERHEFEVDKAGKITEKDEEDAEDEDEEKEGEK